MIIKKLIPFINNGHIFSITRSEHIEKIVEIKIKIQERKFLIGDLKKFLPNKSNEQKYLFDKFEYEEFINNEGVKNIYDTHRVLNNNIPDDVKGYMYMGSFTDRNEDYLHFYLKNN